LEVPVDEILKSSGYGDLRLTTEELDLLKELQKFLSPFQEYTELVSGTKTSSHVSSHAFIPILKAHGLFFGLFLHLKFYFLVQ
jgi:hypothetical protein